MPETFIVKAADGVTDLYGNMWKPFDFDPKKKYPIIAHVYPGPQTEGDDAHLLGRTAASSSSPSSASSSIQVGHRGGTPTRSKAYQSYGYFNLRDYGLADKKTAIEQLAARHPVDRHRPRRHLRPLRRRLHVGRGPARRSRTTSSSRSAVASAGNHDNNIYNDAWAERYHGLKEVAGRRADRQTKDSRHAAERPRTCEAADESRRRTTTRRSKTTRRTTKKTDDKKADDEKRRRQEGRREEGRRQEGRREEGRQEG